MPSQSFPPESFQTFGDLLKYLRRHEQLTQLELSIAVGYSEAQIGRLEKNQRRPDLTALKALFIPALHLDNDPKLAERFLELAQSARQEVAPTPGVAPYKGLLFFDESDSDLFFGREALTTQLADRVTGLTIDASTRLLAVVGASGSGKSSLVRAGLAVALRHGGWEVRIFTPGANPLKALEMQLGLYQAKTGTDRILILVDQFEEVFTLCHDEAERLAFIQKLFALAQHASHKITILIALRADFYSHCAQYPMLRAAVAAQQEYIGQMTTEELRRAIEEPARQAGWQFEPGLADILLQDVGAQRTSEPEPGALPLLSHALLATWERRRGRTLTLDGYHASGGVRGAIAETAEGVFTDHLNREQQEMARAVFLRLTELGEGTEDTRRRAALNELVRQSGEAAQLRAVLNTLAEARLITLNEDSAEVAHEALIREWQRLHEWLTQDREGLRLHRHLTDSARDWEMRDRDVSELYRGARLAQVREWADANKDRLNESEEAFLMASIERKEKDALEREARRQREMETARQLAETEKKRAEEQSQTAQRLRRFAIILAGVLFIAVTLAIVATLQGNRASHNAQIAFSRELAAAALLNINDDPELSILLAMEAISQTHTKEAEEVLHQAIQASRVRQSISLTMPDNFTAIGLWSNPEGSRWFAGGPDGGAMWDAQTGAIIYTRTVTAFYDYPPGYVTRAWINKADFSPDGSLLVLPNEEQTDTLPLPGTITILAAETGEELLTFPAHDGPVVDVTFNPEGTQFASAGLDSSIKIWDVSASLAAGMGITATTLCCHQEGQWGLTIVFNPEGTRLATANTDWTVKIWNIVEERELVTINQRVLDMVFSQDGKYLIAGGVDGALLIFEVESGDLHSAMPSAHGANIWQVLSNATGNRLVSSDGSTVKIWDYAEGDLEPNPRVLAGHPDGIQGIQFSSDERYLAIAGNQTVRLWDVSVGGDGELGLFTHDGPVAAIALNPDNNNLASASLDGTAKVWDITTGELLHILPHEDWVVGIAYHPQDQTLATASNDGTVRLWDGRTGHEIRVIAAHEQGGGYFRGAKGLAFSPDGKYLASGGADRLVQVWDTRTGEAVMTLTGHGNTVHAVVYSSTGRRLITGDADGTIKIWDTADGRELWELRGDPSTIWNMNIGHDGSHLAVGHESGQVVVWELPNYEARATGRPEILLQFQHDDGRVVGVNFSPDDKILIVSAGRTSLYDAQTGEAMIDLVHPLGANDAVFSLDGGIVVTAGNDGLVRLMTANLDELLALARTRVTRSFSPVECQQYLHVAECPDE